MRKLINCQKKIDVLKNAALQAKIAALIGLILGIIYSVGGFFIDLLVTFSVIATPETPGLSYGTLLAFGALIGMPLIAAVIGFTYGLIGGFLYNLFVYSIRK